jgi:hypothetical protein
MTGDATKPYRELDTIQHICRRGPRGGGGRKREKKKKRLECRKKEKRKDGERDGVIR